MEQTVNKCPMWGAFTVLTYIFLQKNHILLLILVEKQEEETFFRPALLSNLVASQPLKNLYIHKIGKKVVKTRKVNDEVTLFPPLGVT